MNEGMETRQEAVAVIRGRDAGTEGAEKSGWHPCSITGTGSDGSYM